MPQREVIPLGRQIRTDPTKRQAGHKKATANKNPGETNQDARNSKNTLEYIWTTNSGSKVTRHTLSHKCVEKFNSLAAVAKREWGLRFKCLQILYSSAFIPIATYAAAAWSDKLNSTSTRELLRAQRCVSTPNNKSLQHGLD